MQPSGRSWRSRELISAAPTSANANAPVTIEGGNLHGP
jgi:hypothetical protein